MLASTIHPRLRVLCHHPRLLGVIVAQRYTICFCWARSQAIHTDSQACVEPKHSAIPFHLEGSGGGYKQWRRQGKRRSNAQQGRDKSFLRGHNESEGVFMLAFEESSHCLISARTAQRRLVAKTMRPIA